MLYYLSLMFLTILDILNGNVNIIPFSNFINIIYNNSSVSNYEEINILEKVSDIKQPLIKTFPFLNSISELCVQSDKLFMDKDCLNLGECKKIRSFRLKGNYIKEIPEYIKSFKYIHDLNFYLNQLESSCLDIISELSTLRYLNLEKNIIEEIPRNILKLVDLRELRLSTGNFTTVPEFISGLRLKKLYLTNLNPVLDKFKYIKRNEDIGLKIINDFLKIKTLECLIISPNKISNLKFYNINYNIKRLDLFSNNISTLPDSIIKLQRLEYLNLSNNLFTIIPTILFQLKNLKELDLKDNFIISYKDISFYSLETLHISFNDKCEEFSINFISSPLKHLYIYDGPYSHKIFSEIFHMAYLKSLSFYGEYMILGINEEIKLFKNIKYLYIDSFTIASIKDSLFELKTLKILHLKLDQKETKGFPRRFFYDLKRLKSLENLSLIDYNRKSILNDKMFDIENLRKLELSGFFIENIEGFSRLINLKYLFIRNVIFNKSLEEVKLCLKKPNKRVRYLSCIYDSNFLEYENKYDFY